MIKTLPSNAGDVDSSPGWGTKISHVSWKLSQHTTTREPEDCSEDPAVKTRHSQTN